MQAYKRWLMICSFSFVICASFVMLFDFYADPLQFYRKADYKVYLSDNQRYQNPGFAKNYNYDTVVIGTSTSENFLPSYIDKRLHVKTLKLSMSGSTAHEQYLIAKVAFEHKKIKNVIWGIDSFSNSKKPNAVRDDYFQQVFPMYFYDQNIVNDFPYLLNINTIQKAFDVINLNLSNGTDPNGSLESLNNWNKYYKYGKKYVMDDFKQIDRRIALKYNDYSFANLKANIDQNVIPIIEKHKDTQFYLFYPPYSLLFQQACYSRDKRIINNWWKVKQYMVNRLAKFSNVKIYDFQGALDIIEDLDNYKDSVHYSQEVNTAIIDKIAQGQYELNIKNFDTHKRKFFQEINKPFMGK